MSSPENLGKQFSGRGVALMLIGLMATGALAFWSFTRWADPDAQTIQQPAPAALSRNNSTYSIDLMSLEGGPCPEGTASLGKFGTNCQIGEEITVVGPSKAQRMAILLNGGKIEPRVSSRDWKRSAREALRDFGQVLRDYVKSFVKTEQHISVPETPKDPCPQTRPGALFGRRMKSIPMTQPKEQDLPQSDVLVSRGELPARNPHSALDAQRVLEDLGDSRGGEPVPALRHPAFLSLAVEHLERLDLYSLRVPSDDDVGPDGDGDRSLRVFAQREARHVQHRRLLLQPT